MVRLTIVLVAFAWLVAGPASAASDGTLRLALQRDLEHYLTLRSKAERISAISLSVSLRGEPGTIDLTVGRTEYGGKAPVQSCRRPATSRAGLAPCTLGKCSRPSNRTN